MDRSRLARVLAAVTLLTTGLVVGAPPASALNVITVTSTTDGGAGSLRAAIDTANGDGDSTEIRLAAGTTYNLTICGGDEDGNASGDLDHTDGDHLVIVGDGSTINQTCDGQRILHDHSDHDLTIRGVTFTGGDATVDGGAVLDADPGGALIVEDSAFVGNHSDGDGGGLAAWGSPPTQVSRTLFEGNTAGGEGGGLDTGGASAMTTIEDSDFVGNTAGDQGGGSATSGASATTVITGSTYTDNKADGDVGGGAGASGSLSSTEVVDTHFSRNEAVGGGGGLAARGADSRATITGSTFDANSAGEDGGGASIGGGGDTIVTVTNSTFSENTASITGGGLYVSNDLRVAYLEYSTFAGNSAPEGANYADASTDVDTTALDGFATVLTDPRGGGANCHLAGTPSSHGYNWVTDDSCGFPEPSDTAGGADPQLGALADNGGPTPTRLPAETSPLLDAIPDADCQASSPITDDQRDVSRPQGSGCDIGSVEARASDYPDDTTTTSTTENGGTTPTSSAAAPTALTPTFTG